MQITAEEWVLWVAYFRLLDSEAKKGKR